MLDTSKDSDVDHRFSIQSRLQLLFIWNAFSFVLVHLDCICKLASNKLLVNQLNFFEQD